MEVRISVSDELYQQFVEECKKSGTKVTWLNRILLENAMFEHIEAEKKLKEVDK